MKTESEKFLLRAKDCLEDAQLLHRSGRIAGAINRSYYAVFDSILALLFEKGSLVKTHAGAQNRFHQLFILTGLFSPELGRETKKLFGKRIAGDYEPDADLTEEDAQKAVELAAQFLEMARKWLLQQP